MAASPRSANRSRRELLAGLAAPQAVGTLRASPPLRGAMRERIADADFAPAECVAERRENRPRSSRTMRAARRALSAIAVRDAIETRIGTRAAQSDASSLRALLAKRTCIAAHRRERMLEQRQQWHRREFRIRRFGEQAEKCAGRRMRERPAGGIVDGDVPAPQFGGDAPRQRAIRRDERRGLSSASPMLRATRAR